MAVLDLLTGESVATVGCLGGLLGCGSAEGDVGVAGLIGDGELEYG